MDPLTNLKMRNIENLHDSIDNINRTGVEQKGELVKDINRKKEILISSIQKELKQCVQVERSLFSQGFNSTEAYSKLEEYNLFIQQQHDKGSELIGNINAAKNFQQLNQVEMSLYNPFINELQTKCSIYAKHTAFAVPRATATVTPITRTTPEVTTEIKSVGVGKTDINVYHGALGTDVNINKEATPGSPSHSVHVSGAKGSVKIAHQPSSIAGPVPSPQPVRALSSFPVAVSPIRVARPVVPVAVTPVQPDKAVVPVQRVVPVTTSPVRVARPVVPVAVTPVRVARPVVPVAVTPVQPVKAVVTHAHIPRNRNGDKLSVQAGTKVVIEKYHGDWALVATPTGERGYVSRHYLRQL